MADKKAEVNSIKIQLPNQYFWLDIDEARELHRQLDELFGSKPAPATPVPYPIQPWVPDTVRPPTMPWENPVWCEMSTVKASDDYPPNVSVVMSCGDEPPDEIL